MKRFAFLLVFLAGFATLAFPEFKGKSLRAGIDIPMKGEIHFGSITFGPASLGFTGKAIVKALDRDGEAVKQERFFELAYSDIDQVTAAGNYENFMKIFPKKKSDFAKENEDFMKPGAEGSYMLVELFKKEPLKASWDLAKEFKAAIEGRAGVQTAAVGPTAVADDLGRITGKAPAMYFNTYKSVLGMPTGNAEEGQIQIFEGAFVFSALVDPAKFDQGKKSYLSANKFSFTIPRKDVFAIDVKDGGANAYIFVKFGEDSGFFQAAGALMTKSKKNNEIVFRVAARDAHYFSGN